jgi:hypothetical protein
MSKELEITTKFCHPYMNFGGEDGCSDVVLKVPQKEVIKLQSVANSSSENKGFSASDFIHHADSFSFSFGLVLIFYLIAKSVGAVLTIFK